METVFQLIDMAVTFVTAVNEFIAAIQYIFDQITTVLHAFYAVFQFVQQILPKIYSLSNVVPMWLFAFPLAFISWRIIIFIKNAGGD